MNLSLYTSYTGAVTYLSDAYNNFHCLSDRGEAGGGVVEDEILS